MHEDIVIQDREELYYLLSEAAEFEHSVMCSYLYAMWSLKREASEGVTAEELAAIERWRRSLRQVALEEMLHLSLVNNLLAATGASPHLWRPQFPVRPGWFPADVVMRLSPFSEATIEHFMYIERPEGIQMVDGAGFDHPAHHPRAARPDLLSPAPQDYSSQGQLYHSVLRGLSKLVEDFGEEKVFVGHGEAQVGASEFGLPGIFRVEGLASAKRAVEEIVLQGEGAPAHRDGSHYQRFAAIRAELEQMKRARPGFAPARPVVENPALGETDGRADVTSICDPLTAKLVDLGNALYSLMMRTFAQVFAPAPLPRELRVGLAAAATEIMYCMSYVGEVATRLPVGPTKPGATAGLTFALSLSSGQLVQRCAAQILSERSRELAGAAAKLEALVPLLGIPKRLAAVAERFA
ncbi:MAG TPA: ferritin-like protein, partial [Stellaceae bacterium]|nr:ferritin-like protein [Stellaceae bacterium]